MSHPQTPLLLGLVSGEAEALLLARVALPPIVGGNILPFSPRRGRASQACTAALFAFPDRLEGEDTAARPVTPGRTIG